MLLAQWNGGAFSPYTSMYSLISSLISRLHLEQETFVRQARCRLAVLLLMGNTRAVHGAAARWSKRRGVRTRTEERRDVKAVGT
jgi:hypothetical protein